MGEGFRARSSHARRLLAQVHGMRAYTAITLHMAPCSHARPDRQCPMQHPPCKQPVFSRGRDAVQPLPYSSPRRATSMSWQRCVEGVPPNSTAGAMRTWAQGVAIAICALLTPLRSTLHRVSALLLWSPHPCCSGGQVLLLCRVPAAPIQVLPRQQLHRGRLHPSCLASFQLRAAAAA